jgi:hypothetical protein
MASPRAVRPLDIILFIVPMREQDSRCMGFGPVSWGLSFPAGVRLTIVLLVWPVDSDMPIMMAF